MRPEVDDDALDDLAFEAGWQLQNVVPEGPQRPSQRIFSISGGESAVYFVTDARLGVTYAAATGPQAADLLERVASGVAAHRAEDAEPLLESDDLGAIRSGLAIAVLAGEPEGLAPRVMALAEAPDPRVRNAVLTAITYAPSPAFAPAVARMAGGDPEPALRQAAAQIQAAFPSLGDSR